MSALLYKDSPKDIFFFSDTQDKVLKKFYSFTPRHIMCHYVEYDWPHHGNGYTAKFKTASKYSKDDGFSLVPYFEYDGKKYTAHLHWHGRRNQGTRLSISKGDPKKKNMRN
eukprot:374558_1